MGALPFPELVDLVLRLLCFFILLIRDSKLSLRSFMLWQQHIIVCDGNFCWPIFVLLLVLLVAFIIKVLIGKFDDSNLVDGHFDFIIRVLHFPYLVKFKCEHCPEA